MTAYGPDRRGGRRRATYCRGREARRRRQNERRRCGPRARPLSSHGRYITVIAKSSEDREGRIESVDVLRGLTIAGMIVVDDPGTWSAVYPPLLHAEWNGWTYTDTIFPFFLFRRVSLVPRSAAAPRDDPGLLRRLAGCRGASRWAARSTSPRTCAGTGSLPDPGRAAADRRVRPAGRRPAPGGRARAGRRGRVSVGYGALLLAA